MRMRKFNQAAVSNFLTEEFAQKRKVQSEPMVLTSLIFSERITVPVPVTLRATCNYPRYNQQIKNKLDNVGKGLSSKQAAKAVRQIRNAAKKQ